MSFGFCDDEASVPSYFVEYYAVFFVEYVIHVESHVMDFASFFKKSRGVLMLKFCVAHGVAVLLFCFPRILVGLLGFFRKV